MVLICILTVYATTFTVFSYDSWAYHLPFASILLNIGGGKEAFHLCMPMQIRYDGFPKLFEFLQGALWKLTGSLQSVVLPQMLALAAFVFVLQRRLSISPVLSLAAFFMSPLLLIHAVATNNDLFPAILIASGLVIVADVLSEEREIAPTTWLQIAFFFAVASMTKYQATLVVSVAIAIFAITLLVQRRLELKYVPWFIFLALTVYVQEIHNLLVYHNPFYPVSVQFGGRTVFAGPEVEYSNKPQYGPHIGIYYFLTSITEFDWIKRGVVAFYSFEMGTGDIPRYFGAARTGGFGQAYVMASLSVLIAQFLFWRNLDRKQKAIACTTVVALAVTALMPQSHELRYWLYLPLVLNVAMLRFFRIMNFGFIKVVFLMLPFMILGIASSTGYIWDSRYVPAKLDDKYVNLGQNTKMVDYSEYIDFRYSRAITGQNTILSCNK
jgi:hypothetical protein